MNKKLSGAQLVIVPITKVGENRLPYVDNIAKRYVKYIDFCRVFHLPDTTEKATYLCENLYLTLADQYGNTNIIDGMPLNRFDYFGLSSGVRQAIGSKISMQDSFILNTDPKYVGLNVALMVYYDLEEFSRRNMTDKTVVDFVTVPITTIQRYNKFPDSDRMVNKRFRRIMCDPTCTIAPDFSPLVKDDIVISNIFITLRKGSYNVVENMPLTLLWQSAMLEKTEWANIIFDFNSSYITIGGAGTVDHPENYLGKSVFLNFEYEA